jgi:hypothetical protein
MAIRMGSIATNWLTISRRSEQVLAMGQVLPDGARIYALRPSFETSKKLDRSFFHVIQFWTVSHDADISSFFALRGQQPLVRREPLCDDSDVTKCFAGYDFIWTYDPPALLRQDILRIAVPAATWEKVTLWRLNGKAVSSTSLRPNLGLP